MMGRALESHAEMPVFEINCGLANLLEALRLLGADLPDIPGVIRRLVVELAARDITRVIRSGIARNLSAVEPSVLGGVVRQTRHLVNILCVRYDGLEIMQVRIAWCHPQNSIREMTSDLVGLPRGTILVEYRMTVSGPWDYLSGPIIFVFWG